MAHCEDTSRLPACARRIRRAAGGTNATAWRGPIVSVLAIAGTICAGAVSGDDAIYKITDVSERTKIAVAAADDAATSTVATPTIGFIVEPGFKIGVGIHLSPRDGPSDGMLDHFKALGVTSDRADLLWGWVERRKGEREFGPGLGHIERFMAKAREIGVDPLIILAYGNSLYDERGYPLSPETQDGFVAYAVSVAQHFKGVVRRYEVWNEWNIGMGAVPRVRGAKGNPVAYTKLLEKVYLALKAVDPQIVVLGGATAGVDMGWSRQVFQAGGLNSMDGFSAHPYVYPAVPERAIGGLDALEAEASRSAGGREIPIYVTEVGWPTHRGDKGTDASVAADYLARFYLLASTRSFIKGVWWYDLVDDGRDPANNEHHFGLFEPDRSPKPASCAMAVVAKLLAAYKPLSANHQPDGLWVAKFGDGRQFVYALWTQDRGSQVSITMQAATPAGAGITAHGICRDSSITGSGTASVTAVITGSPVLFSTTAESITLR